jgi:zinc protease
MRNFRMTLGRILRPLAAILLLLAAAQRAEAIEIERVVSPMGIEAWLVHEETVPLIAMSFAFAAGATQDPAGREGVANLMSGLLDEGAGDLDSKAFQAELDEYSIELSFSAGLDSFVGSLTTLSDNRDEAERLVALALTSPRFDAEPVERIRAQVAARIKRNEQDPDTVAGDALTAALYPDHPYGRQVEGTVESLAAVTIGDIRDFHRKAFARDHLKISVVGAINAATLGPMLDRIFGALPEKSDIVAVPDAQPMLTGSTDIAMNIPQTVINFAGVGLKRDDPDFVPASVATLILGGGGMTSRLYSEVREKRGLAYSVGLGLRAYDHSGLVVGGTRTRADQADEVTELIRSEIARFAKDGATEEELAKAKSYLIGSYALRFTTSNAIAAQLLSIQMDNLGIDYVNRRNGLIAAVTLDDVKRVAKRLFGGEMLFIRVGQAAS